MRVGECALPARPFVFYRAGHLRHRRMYVGVRCNDNLFCVATHSGMNLLTNLWLKCIASKRVVGVGVWVGVWVGGYTGYANITSCDYCQPFFFFFANIR